MFPWCVRLLGLVMLARAEGNIMIYSQDLPHTLADEFRDMPASFGPDLPSEGLRGFLVVGEPADGCGEMAKPPPDENFTGSWVVVVARYNCSFEMKVRNAQAAGYQCAIVRNVNSTDLETMSANNVTGINIPSVFVSEVTGIILSEEYNYTNRYYIMLNGDLPFNINTHLLLPFAIVVVLCLLVILVFMIVKCIKDRRRARRHRLPNRSLKKIPTCKFSKGDPYETCAICLDDYQEGERLRVLPCAHAYHTKCVDPWLTQNRRVCPVCKRRVFAAGERRRPHSDTDTDDTEPLVGDSQGNDTQGGTFEEQTENPFVRATRYIARLRARQENSAEVEAPQVSAIGENNEQINSNEIAVEVEPVDDTQPLISSRRTRRGRSRRSRSAQAPVTSPAEIGVAALPAPRQQTDRRVVDL